MYRFLFLSVACLVVFGAAAQANLVVNPGFEGPQSQSLLPPPPLTQAIASWDSPWQTDYNGFEYTVYTLTTVNPHSGQFAVQGYDYGGPAPVAIQQYVPLTPNTQYYWSFWYYTTGAGWGAGNVTDVRFVTWAGGVPSYNRIDLLWGSPYEPSPGWVQHSGTFTTGPGVTMGGFSLSTYQGAGPAGDSIFFDDFSITPVPEPGTLACLLSGLGLAVTTMRRKMRA